MNYPYTTTKVDWKRPKIAREILQSFMKRSDLLGLWHCLGVLFILASLAYLSYRFYKSEQWVLLAAGLYIYGGLFAFNPQTHELAHRTVFRSRWLNDLFGRVFGVVHWNSNLATYRMSHKYHHRYTLHGQSEAERVVPRVQTIESVLQRAILVIDISGFITALYNQLFMVFCPYLKNPRLTIWSRYVYEMATPKERRDAYWRNLSQLIIHCVIALIVIAIGEWFIIVLVSLPKFYGARWYHMLVHDTMHVGRQAETDDFRENTRTVRVDPFTSFMYWHMEWHTEHHAFPAVPCYQLKKFYQATSEHWEVPQTLTQAWSEMNKESNKLLLIG